VLTGLLLFKSMNGFHQFSPLHNPDAKPRVVTARGDLAENEKSTIELFNSASPAVVHITRLNLEQQGINMKPLEIPSGTGTGFIWDADGHVVTNFHVIDSADGARVTLYDNSVWQAELVGSARDKDLAVLKIDAPKEMLHPILIGESNNLSVGQSVFAIGNPFGLDHTLTTGVISGLGREITSVTQRPIRDVIQTDAAINPGNSGGPLLDSAGRLIGVNTAIYSPSGTYAGVGFAVPVDTVNRIIPQLVQTGEVKRPGLGIYPMPDDYTRKQGLTGVIVGGVAEGSAATKQGMLPMRYDKQGHLLLGDLIIAMNDHPIKDINDLFRVLDMHKIGDELTVTILRAGKELDLKIVLQSI
jgi:S1-C subfamily serine protease